VKVDRLQLGIRPWPVQAISRLLSCKPYIQGKLDGMARLRVREVAQEKGLDIAMPRLVPPGRATGLLLKLSMTSDVRRGYSDDRKEKSIFCGVIFRYLSWHIIKNIRDRIHNS
jgi:hypothetical protein